jgi:hypothetical protein
MFVSRLARMARPLQHAIGAEFIRSRVWVQHSISFFKVDVFYATRIFD